MIYSDFHFPKFLYWPILDRLPILSVVVCELLNPAMEVYSLT